MNGPAPPAHVRDRPIPWVPAEPGDARMLPISQVFATSGTWERAALWAADDPTRGPDWLAAWYGAFARASAAPCVVWQPREGLAGLLPLTAVRRGPMRVLCSPTNGHSQRAPYLCAAGEEATFAAAAIHALEGLHGWDALRLQGLSPTAAQALAAAAERAGWRVEVERDFRHLLRDHALPLVERSRDTSKRQARQERALARMGEISCRWAEGTAAVPALEDYFVAERQSWKARDGELLTANAAIAGFYRTLADGSGSGLEVGFLRVDDRIAAGILLLRRGRRRVALKIFHDDGFARFSPAACLLRSAAERAAPGVLDLYTGRDVYAPLANAEMRLRDLLLWPPRPRARLLRTLRTAAHRLPRG